jgi:hypothetical protein
VDEDLCKILHCRCVSDKSLWSFIGLVFDVVFRLLGVASSLGGLEEKVAAEVCSLWHHWIYDRKSTT